MGSAIGFSDGGLLSGLGADIGKKISPGISNRITSGTNTSMTDLDILAILFLCLTSMRPRSCPHLDFDLIIVRIHIRIYT